MTDTYAPHAYVFTSHICVEAAVFLRILVDFHMKTAKTANFHKKRHQLS